MKAALERQRPEIHSVVDLPSHLRRIRPAKRRLAGDVARAETGIAAQALDAVALRVHADVKAHYAELYRLDRTAAILEESRKLLESLRDAARARLETGEGILENVLKVQTELTRLDVELGAGGGVEGQVAGGLLRR